jgi:hypothetical protein
MPTISVDQVLVRNRANFFQQAGKLVGGQEPFSEFGFGVGERQAMVCSEAYFLLNNWYKQVRLQSVEEPTKNSKIAAFEVFAIAIVCPFRPANPPPVPNSVTMLANPIFAMRCACATMNDFSFNKRGFAYKDRFYQGIRNLSFRPLENYLDETISNRRNLFEPFKLEISRSELVQLEDKINMFEVLEQISDH